MRPSGARWTKPSSTTSPLAERDEWETWLAKQCRQHAAYTAEIVRLERELNARVYALFDLSPDEIALIEASTPG